MIRADKWPDELPPEIKRIREKAAERLYKYDGAGEGMFGHTSFDRANERIKQGYLENADALLFKLTELGARIKINGKWYGLDGTLKEVDQDGN
ncbi:hypothetical protein ES708_33081 [subsurface metagenome]|uniref:Uncharacterized protein n=1 Tax=marine sediment metagenome TaxID=412755 RepID=X1SUG8_9ZZZZ